MAGILEEVLNDEEVLSDETPRIATEAQIAAAVVESTIVESSLTIMKEGNEHRAGPPGTANTANATSAPYFFKEEYYHVELDPLKPMGLLFNQRSLQAEHRFNSAAPDMAFTDMDDDDMNQEQDPADVFDHTKLYTVNKKLAPIVVSRVWKKEQCGSGKRGGIAVKTGDMLRRVTVVEVLKDYESTSESSSRPGSGRPGSREEAAGAIVGAIRRNVVVYNPTSGEIEKKIVDERGIQRQKVLQSFEVKDLAEFVQKYGKVKKKLKKKKNLDIIPEMDEGAASTALGALRQETNIYATIVVLEFSRLPIRTVEKLQINPLKTLGVMIQQLTRDAILALSGGPAGTSGNDIMVFSDLPVNAGVNEEQSAERADVDTNFAELTNTIQQYPAMVVSKINTNTKAGAAADDATKPIYAYQQGLRRGDVVRCVNDQPVTDVSHMIKLLVAERKKAKKVMKKKNITEVDQLEEKFFVNFEVARLLDANAIAAADGSAALDNKVELGIIKDENVAAIADPATAAVDSNKPAEDIALTNSRTLAQRQELAAEQANNGAATKRKSSIARLAGTEQKEETIEDPATEVAEASATGNSELVQDDLPPEFSTSRGKGRPTVNLGDVFQGVLILSVIVKCLEDGLISV